MELYNGDCLVGMKNIKDKSVDLILADLPFGVTACKWDSIIPFDELWEQYKRIIKHNGAIILFAVQPFTTKLIASNLKMFKYCWIWVKPQGVDPFMTKIRPLNNYEDIVVFCNGKTPYFPQKSKGKPYHVKRDSKSRLKESNNAIMKPTETKNDGDRFPVRTLNFNQERGLHATQKPVALLEYLIKTYTLEGETVLDNTMGSGSTGIACVNTNRYFIGMEKDEQIFQTAKNRIKNYIEGE
jgi:site-specific DNA-methyltransferase (adenine-specific)